MAFETWESGLRHLRRILIKSVAPGCTIMAFERAYPLKTFSPVVSIRTVNSGGHIA
jgi:hypothetical protein